MAVGRMSPRRGVARGIVLGVADGLFVVLAPEAPRRAVGRRPFARIGGPSCCGKERVRLVLRGEEHLKRHLLDLVLQLLELVDVFVLVFEDVHEDVARSVVEHLAG